MKSAKVGTMLGPVLWAGLILALGCPRKSVEPDGAEDGRSKERTAGERPAAQPAPAHGPASEARQQEESAAKSPPTPPAPALGSAPDELPGRQTKEAGQRVSPGEALKRSGQWMNGTAEDRAKAIRSANLGARALPVELTRMARQGAEEGVEALLALSRESAPMGLEAIEALGETGATSLHARVGAVLKERFGDSNVSVVCASAHSYIRVLGDASIAEMRAFVRRNWARSDGWGERVCGAAVKALGELDSSAGDRLLMEELRRANRPDWLPDYGSAVVKALAKTELKEARTNVRGHVVVRPPRPLSAEARAALEAYAAALERKMPGPDNPPARRYIEEKIAEARAALAGMFHTPA
ncbi:MAG: hypothetical protein QME60_01770 [Verrucomicrobiota bacterium]|nr:hypothetical protein [Verrucomicrobiota bacterium]